MENFPQYSRAVHSKSLEWKDCEQFQKVGAYPRPRDLAKGCEGHKGRVSSAWKEGWVENFPQYCRAVLSKSLEWKDCEQFEKVGAYPRPRDLAKGWEGHKGRLS